MIDWLQPSASLPQDADRAVLIGRAWIPSVNGPSPVLVRAGVVYDLSADAPTSSQLLELEDPLEAISGAGTLPMVGSVADLLVNTPPDRRDPGSPFLLAPCDLQAVKASGVTFVASLLERVIEEQARGDAAKAEGLRNAIVALIGNSLHDVRPGSPDAMRLKGMLIAQGIWSQYLEVGIGPDAEIFTKCPPMASVGTGVDVGIHPRSEWNNPEPEVVLAVNSRGRAVGAALGNDVNLRDFEGRSALLLGKAKDNNASSAIGPFIRLFDSHFGMDDVRACQLTLHMQGPEGFAFTGRSSMAEISRDPLEIVEHTIGPTHQYPDGVMLFLGTMFAPTIDRSSPGKGFTHVVGDIVTVATPKLGALVNRVNHSDRIAPWTFGTGALMRNLCARGLIQPLNNPAEPGRTRQN
jgi:fumarylacetoacetate (FAA) hydrolase family protein